MKSMRILAVVALLVILVACAADDPNRRAKTGAAIGAVAGAVVGHQFNSSSGRYVGAIVGALGGGAVGHYMDRQQQDMEAALAEQQAAHDLQVQRLKDDSLKISVPGEVSFDFDSAALNPAFVPTLDSMADVLRQYEKTVVHVVGHTDSVGSATYNQQLSERRAESVAAAFRQRGVAPERLRIEGRGQTEPRAGNDTEAGRQLNRRVDIVIRPIVEGQEELAVQPPPPEGEGI